MKQPLRSFIHGAHECLTPVTQPFELIAAKGKLYFFKKDCSFIMVLNFFIYVTRKRNGEAKP